MTELGGYLNEQDLIEECAKAAQSMNAGPMIDQWTLGMLSESEKRLHRHSAKAVIGVLRRRQCLSDIGLEQVKLSEQRLTQSQTE